MGETRREATPEETRAVLMLLKALGLIALVACIAVPAYIALDRSENAPGETIARIPLRAPGSGRTRFTLGARTRVRIWLEQHLRYAWTSDPRAFGGQRSVYRLGPPVTYAIEVKQGETTLFARTLSSRDCDFLTVGTSEILGVRTLDRACGTTAWFDAPAAVIDAEATLSYLVEGSVRDVTDIGVSFRSP